MNFKHSRNLIPSGTQIAKICGIAWSPNNMRLAVATADKKIVLFGEEGNKKESFGTKAGGAIKNY